MSEEMVSCELPRLHAPVCGWLHLHRAYRQSGSQAGGAQVARLLGIYGIAVAGATNIPGAVGKPGGGFCQGATDQGLDAAQEAGPGERRLGSGTAVLHRPWFDRLTMSGEGRRARGEAGPGGAL